MSSDYVAEKAMSDINEKIKSVESLSEDKIDFSSRLLPRSAWNSQLAYLRVVFKAHKALDRIEQEAGILRNYPKIY